MVSLDSIARSLHYDRPTTHDKPYPLRAIIEFDAMSTLSVHQFEFSGCVLDWGISAMKSANTCPFFNSLSLYWMPYSLSSTAQWAILPEKSGLWSVLRRERSVNTTIECAWKYGRSFLVAIRRVKATFSR